MQKTFKISGQAAMSVNTCMELYIAALTWERDTLEKYPTTHFFSTDQRPIPNKLSQVGL